MLTLKPNKNVDGNTVNYSTADQREERKKEEGLKALQAEHTKKEEGQTF